MSDRFDFLEIGDERPKPPPPPTGADTIGSGGSWKPLRLRARESIGEAGTSAGKFAAPLGLAVDPWGALYVVDSNNHRVQRITTGGDVYVCGRPGNMVGQLWGPQSVAVDPSGRYFFVAEQGNDRVQCFQFSGQHQVTYNGFRGPSGVAFDAEGMLWVADTANGRVLRIDIRTGQPIGGFDKRVGIVRPIAVHCDRVHNVYVTDGATNDVTRYNYSGVRSLALGENRRLADPRQVAVDAQGRIYLAESGADRLHVFDAQGDSLITFDTVSTRTGSLRAPSGVALGPNGEIYVADTLNHRVLLLAWE
jgi:tripartite motif-containing protein 71